MKTQGRRRSREDRKIGMHSSDTGLIYFDDVRVPQRYRIGEEGKGFTYQMLQFQEERLWAAAQLRAGHRALHRGDDRIHAGAQARSASRSSTTRWCTSGWPSSRPRSRCCAR